MDKLRIGIVGCGGIGHVHIESYRALPGCYSVEAVCDLDDHKVQEVASSYTIPHYYNDFEALIGRQDLDVIDICTPPYQHYTQMRQALWRLASTSSVKSRWLARCAKSMN